MRSSTGLKTRPISDSLQKSLTTFREGRTSQRFKINHDLVVSNQKAMPNLTSRSEQSLQIESIQRPYGKNATKFIAETGSQDLSKHSLYDLQKPTQKLNQVHADNKLTFAYIEDQKKSIGTTGGAPIQNSIPSTSKF